MLSADDLEELTNLAIDAAKRAGEMIATSRPERVEYKDGGASLASQVVTEIDTSAEKIILEVLTPTLDRFDLGLLSEEQDDDGSRLVRDYFWCIDPLDGTLPFIEGVAGYAVSIALVARDGTPTIGVVYDPVDDVLFSAVTGAGAFRNGERFEVQSAREAGPLVVYVDRSFERRVDSNEILRSLGDTCEMMGLGGLRIESTYGGVMNAVGVISNPPACYVKYPAPVGSGCLWDFAATACLVAEAGGAQSDIFGQPLDLNRSDSALMNHRGVLFASNDELSQRIQTMKST